MSATINHDDVLVFRDLVTGLPCVVGLSLGRHLHEARPHDLDPRRVEGVHVGRELQLRRDAEVVEPPKRRGVAAMT